ncbi:uncharacterized protein LOC117024592 [Rhinolophus ferrumequinum]|uniref:uncharacterized protein LOC117024592 n=1 Tax=Rhinolophus ferrumequinum TaxID=59479 RepID=UPI00140FABE4|nr:uncharacterized protein LOC117024592 [Rhinolophus ferrumequinum]
MSTAERAAARLHRALADRGVQFKPAELAEQRRCGGGRLGAARAPLFLISYSNFSAPTQLHRHWSDAARGDGSPRQLARGSSALPRCSGCPAALAFGLPLLLLLLPPPLLFPGRAASALASRRAAPPPCAPGVPAVRLAVLRARLTFLPPVTRNWQFLTGPEFCVEPRLELNMHNMPSEVLAQGCTEPYLEAKPSLNVLDSQARSWSLRR